jgi:class 3 adenylate cyclase
LAELPCGTVTFLFTDIEGSTALWERDRVGMGSAVTRHLEILGAAIAAHGGIHFKTVGDAVQAAFPTAPDAVAAALTA